MNQQILEIDMTRPAIQKALTSDQVKEESAKIGLPPELSWAHQGALAGGQHNTGTDTHSQYHLATAAGIEHGWNQTKGLAPRAAMEVTAPHAAAFPSVARTGTPSEVGFHEGMFRVHAYHQAKLNNPPGGGIG